MTVALHLITKAIIFLHMPGLPTHKQEIGSLNATPDAAAKHMLFLHTLTSLAK
jgi:hypothetical protein